MMVFPFNYGCCKSSNFEAADIDGAPVVCFLDGGQ